MDIQAAVTAGRLIERLGWGDAIVLDPDDAASQGPSGPPLVVVADASTTPDTARHLSALVGAGRQVALLSRDRISDATAEWLPVSMPRTDLTLSSLDGVQAATGRAAKTFGDYLSGQVDNEWWEWVGGEGLDEGEFFPDGEDPNGPWPILELQLPDSELGDWRVPIPFDAWDTKYWPGSNTALLRAPFRIVGLDAGADLIARGDLMPSMGEGEAARGGLMGMAILRCTGPRYLHQRADGTSFEADIHTLCVGGIWPIWKSRGQESWVPSEYLSEPAVPSLPEALPPRKTALLLESASYGLGLAALTHGLPALLADVARINATLRELEQPD